MAGKKSRLSHWAQKAYALISGGIMTEKRTPRKPATKFPNLRKKLAKNKVLGKQAKKQYGAK